MSSKVDPISVIGISRAFKEMLTFSDLFKSKLILLKCQDKKEAQNFFLSHVTLNTTEKLPVNKQVSTSCHYVACITTFGCSISE